ncbi:MAG: TonB-dependent receptor plug domain-containing protein, partial [Azoarcus sp.]|nr:TonB-dependent receptor plug domain-containing protein [Azoarcus sp.]
MTSPHPQSVTVITRQRIEDQGFNTLGAVLTQTPGISANNRADQQIETQREPPSLRGPKGRGNPVSRMDCHVASLLAMTIGLI